MTLATMLTPEDAALLASVRKALVNPFADPVIVRDVSMSRSSARAIERHLSALSLVRARSQRAGAAASSPCGSPSPFNADRQIAHGDVYAR